MRKRAFEPCIPAASRKARAAQTGSYRMRVHRDHDQLKLITNGHD